MQNTETLTIAIIVRTKDRPHLLSRCLYSLSKQQRQADEIIVVNDGGQSVTEIINQFPELNINLLNHTKSQGRARAGNLGVEAAHSEIIGFLDDDDRFLPDHLQRLTIAITHFDAQITYSGCLLLQQSLDGEKNLIQEEPLGQYNEPFSAERLRYENYIPLISLLIKRDLWLNVGGFDETFAIFEDWDVLLRLAQRTAFYHVDRITTEYTVWGKSQITRALSKAQWTVVYRQFLDKHLMPLAYADKLEFLANYWVISQERRGIVQETQQEKQTLQIKLLEHQQKLLQLQQQTQHYQEQNTFLQHQLTQSQTDSVKLLTQRQAEWSAKYETLQSSWATKYDQLQVDYKQSQTAWTEKYESLQNKYEHIQADWTRKYEKAQEENTKKYESLQNKYEHIQVDWARKYEKAQEENTKQYQELKKQSQKQILQLQENFSELEETYQTLQKTAHAQNQKYAILQNALHELNKRMAVGINRTTIENILIAKPQTAYAFTTETSSVIADYQRLIVWIQEKGLSFSKTVAFDTPPPRPLSAVYPTFVTFSGTTQQIMEQVPEIGTIPFLVDPGAALVFTVYCTENHFCRFDIVLATRLRINTCQVRVIIRDLTNGQLIRQLQFSAIQVFDNRFHPIVFEPIDDSAGKTYQIELDSPDADTQNGIAAWCHSKKPLIVQTHTLSTETVLSSPHLLPAWVQQNLRILPLSPRLTAKSAKHLFMVNGITPATPLLDVHVFLVRLGKALEQAVNDGQVRLYGKLSSELKNYCQQEEIASLTQFDLTQVQTETVDYIWCCHLYAIPQIDNVERAMEMFTAYPKVGLLIPSERQADGRIRAGYAVLLRDGIIKPFAVGMPADHPYLGYRRIVDASTSDLVIFRRSRLPHLDFSQLNTYMLPMYQITDLIWQLKVQHWETVYEGALCYDNNQAYPQPTEEAFARDCRRFYQRWRSRLPKHFSPLTQLTDLLNPKTQPTVLIIDATLPMYDEDSGSFRLFTLLKIWLSLGYRLTFFPDNLDANFKYRHALEALGIEVFHSGYGIHDALAYRNFDIAFICRVEIGHRYIPFIRLISPKTTILYDTVDIHYIREQRQAEIEDNLQLLQQAEETKRRELSNCLLANRVITVTEDDGRHLQKSLPDLPFSVIPNVHPLQPLPDAGFAQRDGLVFIGNYNHQPNEDAVYFFVQHVLPKIKAQLPDVRLYLIGSHIKAKMKALASQDIEIIGWVDQVEPEFAKRRVFVSYLRYGAGMKGKLGQALSVGLPVVTTTMGAEGMGLIAEETALITDNPEDFAQAVCRLYTDSILWDKLSQQGYAYIEQQFGESAVCKKLQALLATLI